MLRVGPLLQGREVETHHVAPHPEQEGANPGTSCRNRAELPECGRVEQWPQPQGSAPGTAVLYPALLLASPWEPERGWAGSALPLCVWVLTHAQELRPLPCVFFQDQRLVGFPSLRLHFPLRCLADVVSLCPPIPWAVAGSDKRAFVALTHGQGVLPCGCCGQLPGPLQVLNTSSPQHLCAQAGSPGWETQSPAPPFLWQGCA